MNQEEIDPRFRATQKSTVSAAASRNRQKTITRFNVREIIQINQEQVRATSTLHESFARGEGPDQVQE